LSKYEGNRSFLLETKAMNFNNMRVATKLWLGVVLIVAALVALLGMASVRGSAAQEQMDTTYAELGNRVVAASKWSTLTQINATRVLAVITSTDPATDAVFKDLIAETTTQISEVQKAIDGMALDKEEKAQMEKIAATRKTVITIRDAARKLKADGKPEEALKLVNSDYLPAQKIYQGALRELVEMAEKAKANFLTEIAETRALTLKLSIALAMAVLAGIAIGAAFLIRSIKKPLAQANFLAAQIAKGDLSQDIVVDRTDEFGELMRSLSTMSESLQTMVSQVRDSTDSIANFSGEIATGNNELAARTEQAASNLQSTASSMGQLTHTVQQSADNARTASALAASASSVAERGGTVVQEVVTTMQDINTSSKKISDIIGVIDAIAFQTNILALNAAVEAARAGEQGRGFAVVASEVRSLAQRSAEAAKEIKGLIGASVERVESGTRLVSNAGTTMSDIVQSVRRVADVIGEITAAATEQSAGIAIVNQAVGNLDQMTQQNAALVEESAAAAESLRDLSTNLAQVVAVFKTRRAGSGPRAVEPSQGRASLARLAMARLSA
jgi:methyl-accepting chemotaxis protein